MNRDELYPHEQDYVGKTARVEVPLRSVMTLRRVANELRGLAASLEYLSHERVESPASVMLAARMAVRRCNHKMAAIRGRGRPKKHEALDLRTPTHVKQKSLKAEAKHKM
jgi:hypothetical protein